jgi:Calcineurin-like phosphoesterase
MTLSSPAVGSAEKRCAPAGRGARNITRTLAEREAVSRRAPLAAGSFASFAVLSAACAGPADPRDDGALGPAAPLSSTPAHQTGGASPRPPYTPYDGGLPVTGQVGADGGTLSRLLFAAVGDTRPATVDDTGGYPTDIITTIYAGIRALEPRPPMVVSTGDYVFAMPAPRGGESQASAQLDIYMQARARFPGPLFPALGNHECTGATSSNCGRGAADGVTANYSAFLDKMLAPIGKTDPYYAIDIVATDATWTAKFVFIAANAWSSAQEGWFESALARPSTYTFVVRHEPASATSAPGVSPSERLMARYPYTLAIVGHSHTYAHDGDTPRQVLVGNGGAPLSSKDYGFAVFSQRADGAIDVDMLQWQTLGADPSFHFTVRPDGSLR